MSYNLDLLTPNMTFETIDWQIEARRIGMAFGIEGEFRAAFPDDSAGPRWLFKIGDTEPDTITEHTFKVNDRFWVAFYYDRKNRYFIVGEIPRQFPTSFPNKKFSLNWAGTLFRTAGSQIDIEGHWIVAKGFFHLDMLTDEIEANLNVAVSEHQKLEWVLEYDERIKSEVE